MAINRIGRAVVGTVLLVAAVAAAASGQVNPKISARDQLSITVWGVKEFSSKYPVAVDGTLEFPELGRMQVVGLTAGELGRLLAKRLKEADILVNPQVTVELEQTPTKKVTVNGSVRNQGIVAYAGDLTLLEALIKAGGRLPEAADSVLIVREAALRGTAVAGEASEVPTTIEVNAKELESGNLSGNLVLTDGDVVFVKKAAAVTITGYVRSVGAYNIESGMNVEQALALAGGVTERGSDRRIEITRRENGKTITLKGVKKSDLVRPGDIIKVGPRIM